MVRLGVCSLNVYWLPPVGIIFLLQFFWQNTLETFCNHGIFDKICLYISFYANQLVENKIESKNSVLDDNFEDYTIWRLQNLISSEFKKIINELEIVNDAEKEVTVDAEHNPTQE